jgi:sensor c-di-GMP phosphodiesterase-like protein
VEVSVSPDRLTAAWRQDRRWVLAGSLLVSASLLVAVWVAARRGLSFVTDLRTALARDELEVRYQPIFDLEAGTCTGCEALVRWRHPERGPVEPDLFVPLAEGAGLIEAVTDFVVEKALDEIGATLRERPHMELAFNVSAPMLADEEFLRRLADRVGRAGVRPEQIVLEVTEREVVDSGDRAVVNRLNELRRHGFRLGLDDFGIGYSTLGFLRDGGFEVLKVDRSFVAAIGSDSPFASLVDRIVEIGRSFDLEVIAEGIEREDQLEHLRSLGCPRGQGFLLSGPVKAETLVEGVKAGCRRGTVESGDDDLAR